MRDLFNRSNGRIVTRDELYYMLLKYTKSKQLIDQYRYFFCKAGYVTRVGYKKYRLIKRIPETFSRATFEYGDY